MGDDAIFSFHDVTVRAGKRAMVRDITLEVAGRGITVIVGPSGSGKSTLLRLCNRLEVPTSGTVSFRGSDIADLDPRELRRRVGMVFQQPVLLPGSVADNLAVAGPGADRAEMTAALAAAELDADFLDRSGDQLSGGEAQRVCIARTLITGPDALLMDEPTASVDVTLRLGLEKLARRLAGGGVPLLWVTHDLDQARRLADQVVVLVGGSIRARGGREVIDDIPDVRPEELGDG